MEQVETDELILSYLHASRLGLFFEELPGLALALYRFVVLCQHGTTGFRLKSADQIRLGVQLLFSAIMLGFQICNIKEYLRLAEAQNEQRRKVAKAVQGVSTELDSVAGVTHDEITMVLRLRGMLGESLRRMAREVGGDIMILRHVRFSMGIVWNRQEAGGGVDEHAVVSMGAKITAALARRKEIGADAVRERILRKDMVSCSAAALPTVVCFAPPRCLTLWRTFASTAHAAAELLHRAGRCPVARHLATQHAPWTSEERRRGTARSVGRRGRCSASERLGDGGLPQDDVAIFSRAAKHVAGGALAPRGRGAAGDAAGRRKRAVHGAQPAPGVP